MTQLFSFVALFLVFGVVTNLTKVKKNNSMDDNALNVLGTPLQSCCTDPMTGFYRDGFCQTGVTDFGTHVICARMTEAFLMYTKSRGNDLSTPLPVYNFPGLKPGDQWCLCVSRWREAMLAGVAPPIILQATHERALDIVTIEDLKKYSILPRATN